MSTSLHHLAELAGIMLEWEDSQQRTQHPDDDTLRGVLTGLGYPAESEAQMLESTRQLTLLHHPEHLDQLPPLLTGEVERALVLPTVVPPGSAYTLVSETGERTEGTTDDRGALAPVSTPGYYRLVLEGRTLELAVAPGRCTSFEDRRRDARTSSLESGGPHQGGEDEAGAARLTGLGVQLYSLRRNDQDHGMGDIEALARLAEAAAPHGVDAIAISPVHALFPGHPEHCSPYAPSTRLAFNPLYTSLPAYRAGGGAGARDDDRNVGNTSAAERGEGQETGDEKTLIDPVAVGVERWEALSRALEALSPAERAEFNDFRRRQGETLENHCRFEAISEVHGPRDQWPMALYRPDSVEVEAFAERYAANVERFAFAQWQTVCELENAQARARAAGMCVGMIADIAVGVDPRGSQVWSRPQQMLTGLRVGAPPDAFNARGQAWGVTGFSPQGLIACGFEGFIATLRACLTGAGGLRIDHIMGLSRLWLIPAGASPTEGAYVRFPEEDLLRLVALESWRHEAVIVGEDLGTVDPAFRKRLARAGIAGMGVMWFEREGEAFTPAADYPPGSIAMTTTHDLPTMAGWLVGRDIDWRDRLDMLGEGESASDQRLAREADKSALARTLGTPIDVPAHDWLMAALSHIGATPAPLALVPLEDLLALEEQPNLPGTLDAHPNWRRRLPVTVEHLMQAPEVLERFEALNKSRRGQA